MKASELRIGNYVIHPRNECDKIKELGSTNHGDYAKFETTHEGYYFMHEGQELIKPIPITEDWLMRFGFYQNDDLFYIGEIGLYLDGNVWWNDEIINGKLEYVHQLQNLYFALTNQELKINQ